MAAPKRSSNRNYIALVEDGSDERRATELPPASGHSIKNYLLAFAAAIRSVRSEER